MNFLNDAYGGTASHRPQPLCQRRQLRRHEHQPERCAHEQRSQELQRDGRHGDPAAAVTGSGSDTLVLGVSEDAYLGNAQFTVSVDGKQLGGTFTATTLHASGASQNFTFKGDFGSGQHAVAVKFLNDAWAERRAPTATSM